MNTPPEQYTETFDKKHHKCPVCKYEYKFYVKATYTLTRFSKGPRKGEIRYVSNYRRHKEPHYSVSTERVHEGDKGSFVSIEWHSCDLFQEHEGVKHLDLYGGMMGCPSCGAVVLESILDSNKGP